MKDLFEVDLNMIYLNSGTQSKPPSEIINEVDRLRKISYFNPTEMHVLFPESLYTAHIEFSEFINCRPEDLFFSHNVTESLNHFILGTELKDEALIFILDLEYGATLNICKYRSEKEGRKLCSIPISHYFKEDSLSEPELNAKIIKTIVETDFPAGSILIMSHVITTNGFILPIQEISNLLKDRDIIIIVDGAHAIGAFPVDFSEFEAINFYGGNLHKWMMGLSGTGFGWINPNNTFTTNSLLIGWPNYDDVLHLEGFKLDGPAKDYYLKGTIDFAPFMAISELIKWWKRIGPDKIYRLRAKLRSQLVEGLSKNPLLTLISTQTDRSPLLTYRLSKDFSKNKSQIVYKLFDQKLTVATPKMGDEIVLRLSPNVYNDEQEIKRALKILNDYFQ